LLLPICLQTLDHKPNRDTYSLIVSFPDRRDLTMDQRINPPPSTRSSTKKATFDRVLKQVIGIPDDDFLLKALDNDGLDSIPDLLTLTDDQIDALFYNDSTGERVLPLSSRNKLRILHSWNFHLQQVQGVRRVDWLDTTSVNEDEWDEYRIAIYVPAGMPIITTQRTESAASVAPSPRSNNVSNKVLLTMMI